MSLIRVDNIADQEGDNTISTYQMIAILKNLSELFAMLASSDPAEVANAQKAFGMGTAAALDVGTANGNLLRMTSTGLWGLGQTTTGNLLTNLDANDTPAGFYSYSSASTGTLPTGTTFGTLIVIRGATTNNNALITQLAINIDNNAIQSRNYVGNTWSAWKTFYTQANVDDSKWVTVSTFLNNWTNYDSANWPVAQYRKVGSQVFLKGLVKNGNTGEGVPMFVLPTDCRPPTNVVTNPVNASASSLTVGRLDINKNGNVCMVYGSNTYVSLDNVSFWIN